MVSFSIFQNCSTTSLGSTLNKMAPTKIKTGKSKGSTKSSTKRTSKPSSRPASTGSASKTKSQSSVKKAANKPKAKTIAARPRKKKRVYTEKELNIPALNMITPAGVQKPQGKKKGKVFVDDQESMMTILAMVNADKEGQIESKMMKAVCRSPELACIHAS